MYKSTISGILYFMKMVGSLVFLINTIELELKKTYAELCFKVIFITNLNK